MKRWLNARRHRMAHSLERLEEQRELGKRLDEQAPRVQELASFARDQREKNHLTELFLAIHRERG